MMRDAGFEARWKQMRDQIRVWWDRLSDSDVDQIAGRYERLVDVLQEKYGYTPDQVAAEITRHMAPAPAREQETLK